jgi:hypothetical protein
LVTPARELGEAVRNDLQPPAFFDEQPFKQIGGSNETAIGDR